MYKAILAACALLSAGSAWAVVETEFASAQNDVADIASLQRGAKYFVNYCFGCHSANYVRYIRLAEDLHLTEEQLIENLMFTGERPFDTMAIAMPPEDAVRWFGIAPPDLSLIARSRGVDYLYNFLRGFYQDGSTATGVNNVVLPNTAMPHVLWELQGIRRPSPVANGAEGASQTLEVVRPGLLSEQEFDQFARDVVNFLAYIGEPMQLQRQALGIKVIAFLFVFLLFSYLLKKEIWKDVK
jgi:ubiquinol-cytochrome c reductase cytochrome c1 subunit